MTKSEVIDLGMVVVGVVGALATWSWIGYLDATYRVQRALMWVSPVNLVRAYLCLGVCVFVAAWGGYRLLLRSRL